MNLSTFMTIMAGGPGSGCNPAAGQCGRKPGWRKFNPNNVGGYFKRGTVIAHMYITLAGKNGQWHSISDFEERFKGTGKPVVLNRLRELANTGKKSGLWKVEFKNDQVRLIKSSKQEPLPRPMVEDKAHNNLKLDEDALGTKESELQTTKVLGVSNLGGGVNEVVQIKLANGMMAVFKPEPDEKRLKRKGNWYLRENIKPGNTTGREYAAYQVAKLVGIKDLVPVMARREVAGKQGIAMEFYKGYLAGNATDPYDGKLNAARAAAFDYVIGNEDRHHSNWMVPTARGANDTLMLIDHGLSFPEKELNGNRLGIMRGMIRKFEDKCPDPSTMAQPYVKNEDSIVAVMKANGLSSGAISGVRARIKSLSENSSWRYLPVKAF